MRTDDICVLLVNWNCSSDVLSVAHVCREFGLMVAVVDNGSDVLGEPSRLENGLLSEGFTLLLSEVNRGYGGGMNIGLRHLNSIGVRYALLLNPDVEVTSEFLAEIMQFDRTADFGAMGVAQASKDPRGVLHPYPSAACMAGPRPYPLDVAAGRSIESIEVDVVTGACMLLNVEAVKEVGFFDERFFHYKEEFDLTYRLRRHGYKNFYLNDVQLIHRVGGSLAHGSPLANYYYFRNELLFVRWRFGWSGLIRIPGIYRRMLELCWMNRSSALYRRAFWFGLRDGFLGRCGRQDLVRRLLV